MSDHQQQERDYDERNRDAHERRAEVSDELRQRGIRGRLQRDQAAAGKRANDRHRSAHVRPFRAAPGLPSRGWGTHVAAPRRVAPTQEGPNEEVQAMAKKQNTSALGKLRSSISGLV